LAEYELREEKRAGVEEKIEEWLGHDGVMHLEVCRKRGSQHSKIPDSEIDAEEPAGGALGDARSTLRGFYVLDDVTRG
jgi:hypothetical protein